MKTLLALCLLFAAANAFSLDGLRMLLEDELEKRAEVVEEPREITLREFLDNQETPDPLYRSLSERAVDCSQTCGTPPAADHGGKKCATDRWVPEYEAKGSCECLKQYRCCTDQCPVNDLTVCHANNQKGFKYGIEEVDCCGCKVTKCIDCPAPNNDTVTCSKDKPRNCYNYIKNSIHVPTTECYQSTCPENPSDAASPETCDTSCEAQYTDQSPCLFTQQKCKGSKFIASCSKRKVEDNKPRLPLDCYEQPKQEADSAAGNYYDSGSDSCLPCQKWRYDKISCAAKDAAVAAADCHQVGANEYDKKCMRKDTSKDPCECDSYVCEIDHNEPEAKFGAGEVCPKNHVKLAGTSICGSARDLCFPCPAVVPKDQIACAVGTVIQSADTNGCKKFICQPPTVAPGACASNTFTLDANANQFNCVS